MTKKVIIFIFIAVILVNTIYWISLFPKIGRLEHFQSDLIRGLGCGNEYTVKNIIDLLTITDAVLIAISFMVILLYKKD